MSLIVWMSEGYSSFRGKGITLTSLFFTSFGGRKLKFGFEDWIANCEQVLSRRCVCKSGWMCSQTSIGPFGKFIEPPCPKFGHHPTLLVRTVFFIHFVSYNVGILMLRSRLQTMNITIWAIDIRLFLTPIKDYVLRKLVWGANKCTSSKLGRQVAVFSLAANICRSQDWKKSLNHGSQFSLTAETEAFKSFSILAKLQLGLVGPWWYTRAG